MEKKIITISREFGSGGRTVGHMVAEKLGIKTKDGDLNKKFNHAACLSYKIPEIYDSLDEETKTNFMKIIDYVINQ